MTEISPHTGLLLDEGKDVEITMRKKSIDPLSTRIFCIHPEPYEYVTDTKVHAALTANPAEYLSFLERMLKSIAEGRTSIEHPSKLIFNDDHGKGDFRVMPCVVRGEGEAIKTVKIVGTNRAGTTVPAQATVGKAFRLHPQDNYITHIYEACLLSSARTGACAAIALKHLAPSRRKITIVGAGRVAYYTALYTSVLGGVEEITFRARREERAQAIVEWASRLLKGISCRIGVQDDLRRTDVVVFATTSTVPLCRPSDVEAGLVVSLGADAEELHELDSSWASRADVYVDVLDSIHIGDLCAWIAAGKISSAEVIPLLRLLREGPKDPGRTRVFISTGSAMFDNLTIAYLLHQTNHNQRV
jgi:ornithine cyclodeaminase/alanine dehydrogenase-like protein (mu-crystallin family)